MTLLKVVSVAITFVTAATASDAQQARETAAPGTGEKGIGTVTGAGIGRRCGATTPISILLLCALTACAIIASPRYARAGNDSSEGAPSSIDCHSSSSSNDSSCKGEIQEIIVTATHREERLMDVPESIQAITAEDIDRRGLRSAEDYLRGIPGVNQVSTPQGEARESSEERAETSPDYQNFFGSATVASYFKETPITSTQGAAGYSTST